MGFPRAVWLTPPSYDCRRACVPMNGGPRETGAVMAILSQKKQPTFLDVRAVLQGSWGNVWTPRVVLTASGPIAPTALSGLGVDAVLSISEASPEAIRFVLTDPNGLGDRVLDRLRLHGYVLSSTCQFLLRTILDAPERSPDGLAALFPSSLRTAERHFKEDGVPSPRDWSSFSRIIRPILVLQCQEDVSIERVALDAGLPDGAALAHACQRLFGFTVTKARKEIGWPPLLYRFVSGKIRSIRAAPALSAEPN